MARVLGLAISSEALRGVILKSSFNKLELERYVEILLGDIVLDVQDELQDAIVSGEETEAGSGAQEEAPGMEADSLEDRRLREAFRLLSLRVGIAPDRIIASVPGTYASLRVVEVPAGAAKRIQDVLPFELEALLPFDLGESVIDHQPLTKTDTDLAILACAVPKARVAETLSPLTRSNIYPRELAVGAAALDGLTGLVTELSEGGPFLIVDVEAETTDLCLLQEGAPVFVRTLSTGASNPDGLSEELTRTLAGLRARSGTLPGQVFVGGSRGEDNAFIAWVGEVIGVPTGALPLPPTADGVPSGPLGRFAKAAALAGRTRRAGRRINVLQGEFAPRRAVGVVRRYLPAIAISAAAVLVSALLAVWSQYLLLTDSKEALEEQLATVTETAFGTTVESVDEARALLGGARRNNDPLPSFDAYDLVEALTTTIPKEVTHDTQRLSFNLEDDGIGARFEVKGTVPGVRELDDIIQRLKDYECSFCEGDDRRCMREVENRGVTAGREGQNYRLEGSMRCPGAPEPESGRRNRRRSR